MDKTKNKKIANILTISVLAVMLFSLIVLVVQFVKINNLKSLQSNLQKELVQLEETRNHYANQNSYLQSQEFIDDYAREVLGYGKPGETRFR